MITIDGAQGEGGGQILRTALALSLITGRPFRIARIRAGRERPGLKRQHLTAVRAAAEIGHAELHGAELGSTELTFRPGPVAAGEYRFDVGTAGSVSLVLQTVLPPLLRAGAPSVVALTGGTHNMHAPPVDFLAKAFAPILNRLGADSDRPVLDLQLVRPGFYPAGGGEALATITPPASWRPLTLFERGLARHRRARAIVANLSPEIACRELRLVQRSLGWPDEVLYSEEAADSRGPGNVLLVELAYEQVTEVFTGFGARGVTAEQVAMRTVDEVRRYVKSDAPVGEHLVDQLLLPLALGAGGSFRAIDLTPHAKTNIDVIRTFLDVAIETSCEESGCWRVSVGGGAKKL
ncbi:MAG: RNA 3'-terminal phosphate cyclase [Planctomycetota bacterium]